jgi:hypothetical protein
MTDDKHKTESTHTVKAMVNKQLKDVMADGLYCPSLECGCSLDNLFTCCEPQVCECVAARKTGRKNKFGDDEMAPLIKGKVRS